MEISKQTDTPSLSSDGEERKKVTVLIPCYNEQESLPALHARLSAVMESLPDYDWEIILVNDGSSDATLLMMRQLHARNSCWRYVDLSRNFGKETAMLAGMDAASGDCLVIMDADLQHPPEIIAQMLSLWEKGFDDVYGRRRDRGRESWLRKRLSLLYYSILQRASSIPVLQNCGDFRLLDRACIDALTSMRENQRYTKGLYCQIGFRKKEILFNQESREAGVSKMSFRRLASLAIDGITSYTTAPLRFSAVMGFIVSAAAFVYMAWVLVKALFFGDPQAGFPSLMSVMLFLGGVQLISLGVLGEYVGRIFNETKGRPPYFIREIDGKRPKSPSK